MENNILAIIEQKIIARGAHPTEISSLHLKQHTLQGELDQLPILSTISIPINTNCPTLLYPGCGSDIIFPLMYVTTLWPNLKTIQCIFIDEYNMQGIIETTLHNLNISFAREKNILIFYWNNILVRLRILVANVFHIMDKVPPIDIYFERAFRIMKSNYPNYESNIINHLTTNGIIISDSGFTQFTKHQIEEIELSKFTQNTTCQFQSLSSYQEMIIAIKNKHYLLNTTTSTNQIKALSITKNYISSGA